MTSLLDYKLSRLQDDDLRQFTYSFNANQHGINNNSQNDSILALMASSHLHLEENSRHVIAKRIGKVLKESQPKNLESLSLRTTEEGPSQQSIQDLLKFLSTNQSLKEFAISGKVIPDFDLYARAIVQNHHLSKLSILCRDFPMTQVCNLVHTTKTLQTLILCGNRIKMSARHCPVEDWEFKKILHAISANANLQRLELYLFDFQDAFLSMTPAKNHSIQTLVLQDNRLTDKAADLLLDTFQSLQSLQLNSNHAIVTDLLTPLEHVSNLQSLHVTSKYFDGSEMETKLLQNLLRRNQPNLKDLYLCHHHGFLDEQLLFQVGKTFLGRQRSPAGSGNLSGHPLSLKLLSPTSPLGLQSLLDPILSVNQQSAALTVIQTLSLTFKKQSSLPEALQCVLQGPHVAIKSLTLDFVELNNTICHQLWISLRRNTSLQSLKLKGMGVNVQSRAAFRSLAEGLPLLHLQELTLDEGLRESLLALKCFIALPTAATQTSLTKISLSRIVLCDKTCQYIGEFIQHESCFLRHLVLSGCRLSSKGLKSILSAVASDTLALESLELVKDGGFSIQEAQWIGKTVLPRITHLKRLKLHGFSHLSQSYTEETATEFTNLKAVFLQAISQSKVVMDNDLDIDGYHLPSQLRFYRWRNMAHQLLQQTECLPLGLWPAILERFHSKAECPSAIQHLLTNHVNLCEHHANHQRI